MNKMKQVICGLLLMGISQSLALAKDEKTVERPFHIDLKGGYTAVLTGEDDSIDNGFGYGFNFGYRLSRVWGPLSVQVSYFILQTVATADSGDVFIATNAFALGPKVSWPIEGAKDWEIFGEFGLGGAVATAGGANNGEGVVANEEIFLIQAGAGIQYLIKDFLAIGPAFDMQLFIADSSDSDALLGPELRVTAHF